MKFSWLSGILLALALLPPPPALGQSPAAPTLSLTELRTIYTGDGKYLTVDGIEIYVRDEGHGPAILLVHGSASTSRQWDGLARILARHARVIRYDVPGQGLSGPVTDQAAAAVQPADIAIGLLRQLGVGHATIIGVSSGGTLCVDLAAKRPDLVTRMILSNTPADPVPMTGLPASPALAAQIKIARATQFRDQAFWNAFLDFYAGVPSRYNAAIRRQYYDFNRRAPEKNATALIAKVADHPRAVRAMAAVSAPTLLIWGAMDPLLPPPAATALRNYLTHARVSVILLPDVGHFPPMEVPDRFARLVLADMAGATPGAGADRK